MAQRSAGFHHTAVRAARLLHQKKHRLEQRCFLIEGPLLVQAALDNGAQVERVFIETSDRGDAVADSLSQSSTFDPTSIVRVQPRTLESLSQTQAPQGIIAVVRFLHHDASELVRLAPPGQPAVIVVLPNLSDPGNAGTLIRSAVAFGAGAVCLGAQAVEPYNDKLVRASMGALFRIPIVRYDEWPMLLAALREAKFTLIGSDASGMDVRMLTLPERTALVIGQERHGLADIARSDLASIVTIPHSAGVESLNAGVAGSILLYELGRAHQLFDAGNRGTNPS